MQNSNPANAKPAQGDVWVDDSAPATTDSTATTVTTTVN